MISHLKSISIASAVLLGQPPLTRRPRRGSVAGAADHPFRRVLWARQPKGGTRERAVWLAVTPTNGTPPPVQDRSVHIQIARDDSRGLGERARGAIPVSEIKKPRPHRRAQARQQNRFRRATVGKNMPGGLRLSPPGGLRCGR